VDSGDLALMTLLNLCAVLDSVDHVTALRHLEVSYDISDTVHITCFASCLGGRWHYVPIGTTKSTPTAVLFCIVQESPHVVGARLSPNVVGALLFRFSPSMHILCRFGHSSNLSSMLCVGVERRVTGSRMRKAVPPPTM